MNDEFPAETVEDVHSLRQEIDDYKVALKMVKRSDNSSEEVVTLNELATIYRKLGEYDNALNTFIESLQVTMEVEEEVWQAATRFYIALVYIDTDNLGAAEFELEQSLDCFEAAQHPQTDIVRAKLEKVRAMKNKQ